ncbi:MAG: insulinase family protein [Opitutaceae bacterium]|nr:insulinase family protein [Opitutaceae bacterium]
MPFRLFRLTAGLLALAFLLPLRATADFAHEASDLRPDPAARFGKLPNGVRYIILPNAEPRGRVSLRLSVAAGAFMETEPQRGLAHFLEHMAFKGSTHYPPGTLIEFFQRMGMGFGNDSNAYTAFDRTVYMLELAQNDAATLTEGFRIFADYAGGLLILDEQLEPERGVILAEERTRDTVDFRALVAEFNFVLGDTLLPRRLPIGLMEVVRTAPREEFVDFYDTWYRPELMTVIVVGDTTIEEAEPLLTAAFSGLTARAPARPQPDLGQIPAFAGVRARHHLEPEAVATSVSIQTVAAHGREPDTAAKRLADLPRSIAVNILNRRLSTLAKEEDAPFSSGSNGVSFGYDLYRNSAIRLTAKPGRWAEALTVAEHELRRVLEHGFQPAELAEVTAAFRNSLEQAVRTAPTRRSGNLATMLVNGLANDTVFTHPSDNLALLGPALATVTVEDCLRAFREAWSAPGRYVMVSGNEPIAGDAEAAILATYDAARARPVAPLPAIVTESFAYVDFGPVGEITAREQVADLGITLVTFANGVRLNLKPTEFEAGRIRVSARFGSGRLTEPADRPGLAWLAGSTYTAGGLGRHSADDLRRILAGRNVGAGFSVAADAFSLGGMTTPDDLLLQLQLLAAHLTDPGYRPEALRQARESIVQMYRSFAHTPSGPLNLEVQALLAGGDHRFGMPAQAEMEQRTLEEVGAWLAGDLAHGPLELSLVGDFEVEAAIAAAARTFGALPPRNAAADDEALRRLSLPERPFDQTYHVVTEIPKGLVVLYWRTTDGRDVQTARRLNLLGSVLRDRMRVKIRNELGGAYSPGAGSTTSEVFPGYGWMQASVTVDPEQAALIREAVVQIAADLHRDGVTAEELERAKLPQLTSIRESLRDNAYWHGSVLARAQSKPEVLDWARSRLADIESITAEELTALARSYLGADQAFRVTVLPAGGPPTEK